VSAAVVARSFLVLAANTPWVYALARSLAAHGSVTAVRFYDWANHRRLRPQWPETESAVRRVLVTMPQGYAGQFELMFRPLMRRIIERERSRLRRQTRSDPLVVCPYPYLAPWVRDVPDSCLIYYNLDEYSLYDHARPEQIRRLEDELIRRARLTVCLSVHQVETLRARHPAHANRIAHFPLGVVEEFLNPAPESPTLHGTVGYVGNLIDRVDWGFVAAVAERLPEAKFHFVGDLGGESNGARAWQETRARALSLPNIVHAGLVPQAEVREHYWRYAVNWMPYDMAHRFNVASCPTKIMDALASGRPFVSTDIPEIRLYPDRIHAVRSPDEAASRLRALLRGDIRHDPREQIAFAAMQTWPHRAIRLLELLADSGMETELAASGLEVARS